MHRAVLTDVPVRNSLRAGVLLTAAQVRQELQEIKGCILKRDEKGVQTFQATFLKVGWLCCSDNCMWIYQNANDVPVGEFVFELVDSFIFEAIMMQYVVAGCSLDNRTKYGDKINMCDVCYQ